MRHLAFILSALALAGCFAAKTKRATAQDSLTAAQYLADDMGVAERVRAAIPAISAAIEQQIVALWPDCATDSGAVRQVVEARAETVVAELTKSLSQSYARRFSLVELQAIDAYETGPKDEPAKAAFQATPAGARYFAQQPQIAADVRQASQTWTKQYSVRFMDEMKAELRKRGHAL